MASFPAVPVVARRLVILIGVLLMGGSALLLLNACGGGETYSVDTGDLAERFMPSTRSVESHPDSLDDVGLKEEDGHFKVELKTGYEALHRKWSTGYQNMGAGRSRQTRSYATLWSLELSLASLQPEVGISTLRKEKAKSILKKRRDEHQESIQIDVYWFEAEGNSLLTGPGTRVELRVQDRRYKPAKENRGPIRDTFLEAGRRAQYRRNTFHFRRVVDSTDILEGVQEVELRVSPVGEGRDARFAWKWKGEDS